MASSFLAFKIDAIATVSLYRPSVSPLSLSLSPSRDGIYREATCDVRSSVELLFSNLARSIAPLHTRGVAWRRRPDFDHA